MRKNILISKILICVMLIVYVVPINAFADSRTAVGLHIVRNEYVQHYQGQPFDRALTYVAAALTALIQLLYMVLSTRSEE